jgi:hypothetical protein
VEGRRLEVSGSENLLSCHRSSPITHISSNKVPTRNEDIEEIKGGAVRCGAAGHFFAATSLRKDTATDLARAGLPREERNRIGGWAPDSSVPERHYDHSKRIEGVLDAGSEEGVRPLGLEHLRLMIPHQEGTEPLGRRRHRGGKGSPSRQTGVPNPPESS